MIFFVLLLIGIQRPHGILWIFNHLISAGEISMEDTKAKFTELMWKLMSDYPGMNAIKN
jgi:hypothetical protein